MKVQLFAIIILLNLSGCRAGENQKCAKPDDCSSGLTCMPDFTCQSPAKLEDQRKELENLRKDAQFSNDMDEVAAFIAFDVNQPDEAGVKCTGYEDQTKTKQHLLNCWVLRRKELQVHPKCPADHPVNMPDSCLMVKDAMMRAAEMGILKRVTGCSWIKKLNFANCDEAPMPVW